MLSRAEVDKLRELVVEAWMAGDKRKYAAAIRPLLQYVNSGKKARGLVRIGAGTWTRDPHLFSPKYRKGHTE